jgi:hypothetical protein
MVLDPVDKVEVFRKIFFPSPPEAEIRDIEDAIYPDRITMLLIIEREVERAIQEASSLNPPSPNGITNKALQLAAM